MSAFSSLADGIKSRISLLLPVSQQVLFLRYLMAYQLLILLALLLRLTYFSFAPVGATDISDLSSLTPWFVLHVQRYKGLELPIFFVSVFSLCCLTWFYARNSAAQPIRLFTSLSSLCIANALLFACTMLLFFPGQDESILSFCTWHFHPNWLISIGVSVFLLSDFLSTLKFHIIAYVTILICALVSLAPINLYNYSYVLEPAARLLDGEAIRSVTSQYDLLLPLTTMPFLSGKWDLNNYKICLQIANCFFYFWIVYEFSKLVRKEILLFSVFLLVAAKYGFATNDGATLLQISFLRLDLWFPLFVLVVRYGLLSRQTVLYLIAIVLLSKTFACVLALMYVAYVGLVFISKPNLPDLRKIVFAVAPVLFFVGVSQILLPNQRLADYLQYQISFLPMASFSFFWLVAPTLLFCAWTLFSSTSGNLKLDQGCQLLVFLCCGSLVYFLGRSHEENILNIATPLIVCLGLALDRIATRLRASIFLVVLMCGLMSGDVLRIVAQRIDAFRSHGLSPYSEVAAGDFTHLKNEHRALNIDDGKTISCFPYSALEFYYHHFQYGNYRHLPLSQLQVCGTILKKEGMQRYENSLKSRGMQLQIINSGEI